jgi:hypothetical protein
VRHDVLGDSSEDVGLKLFLLDELVVVFVQELFAD